MDFVQSCAWTQMKTGQRRMKSFKNFLDESQLVDYFYEKHPDNLPSSAYARGRKRIDYILFDRALVPAVKKIGSLGLHDGLISDHVLLFADLDEKLLFQGSGKSTSTSSV